MCPGGSDLDTQAYLVLLSLALLCFTDVVFLKADPSPAKRLGLALVQYSIVMAWNQTHPCLFPA